MSQPRSFTESSDGPLVDGGQQETEDDEVPVDPDEPVNSA